MRFRGDDLDGFAFVEDLAEKDEEESPEGFSLSDGGVGEDLLRLGFSGTFLDVVGAWRFSWARAKELPLELATR